MDAHRTVLEATKLMVDRGVGSMVVMDGQQVTGFFTERDLMNRVVVKNRDPHITYLSEVCSKELIKVQANLPCREALDLMRTNRIRHLLVWDGEEFAGLVAMRDLAGLMGEKVALRDRMANLMTAVVFVLVLGVIGLLVFMIPKMLDIANRIPG
ncbi:MAG: CBS domain-containing protein [Magnetococcales bacterium]|nr:CBS domain-containing protein [Magnetococcales bacterium]